MGYKALEVLDDTFQSTKDLLLPFDAGTWLRLAVIVVFTGGGIGFTNFPTGFGDTGTSDYSDEYSPAFEPDIGTNTVTGAFSSAETGLLLIGAGVIGLLTLLFYLSSVFQFVYYRSLIEENVRIRPYLKDHARDGFVYMLFNLSVISLMALIVVGAVASIITSPIIGTLVSLIGFLPLLLLVAVASGLVNNLVLPEMITGSGGFLESLKNVYRDVKTQWSEVAVYVLARFGASIVVGMTTMFMMIGLLIATLIVFGIPALILYSLSPILGLITVILGILVFSALNLLVSVPLKTFMQFYALRFYERL